MAYTPLILTEGESDYEEVRAKLGVGEDDFSSAQIASEAYLGDAEQKIIDALAEQTEVPDLLTILGDDTSGDYVKLRNAVKSYICFLFTPAESNAVNTALTQGEITQDLGGVGTTWIPQRTIYEKECWDELRRLTGWKQFRKLPTS